MDMRKVVAVSLGMALLLGLTACTTGADNQQAEDKETINTVQPEATVQQDTVEEPPAPEIEEVVPVEADPVEDPADMEAGEADDLGATETEQTETANNAEAEAPVEVDETEEVVSNNSGGQSSTTQAPSTQPQQTTQPSTPSGKTGRNSGLFGGGDDSDGTVKEAEYIEGQGWTGGGVSPDRITMDNDPDAEPSLWGN